MSDNDTVSIESLESNDNTETQAALDADLEIETDNEAEGSTQRDRTREGQLQRAERLLNAGEEIPSSLKWAVEEIQSKKRPNKIDSSIKDELKAELKDDSVYDKAEEELKGLGLNKEEFAQFKAKYQLYKSKGFRKGEALSESLEIWRLKNAGSKARVAGSVPDGAGYSDSEQPSWDNYEKLSEKDRLKLLRQVR